MTIDPVTFDSAALAPATDTTARGQAPDFAAWLASQLEETNTKIGEADLQVRKLAVGETTNVHQVMIALEKAHMSLELVVQVRNKCLEAYQSLMQMQI